jgi:hypothetical protein
MLDQFVGYKFYAVEQVDCLNELGFCLNMYEIKKGGRIKKYATVELNILNNLQWDNFKNAVFSKGFVVGKPTKRKLDTFTIEQLDNLLISPF